MDAPPLVTVVGVFAEPQQAEHALARLRGQGYPPDAVSVLTQQDGVELPFATEEDDDEAAEGALAGAALGGVLGGLGGWLVGVGLLAIPGVGPLLAAGPLAVALAGAATGALAGGVTGALVDAAVPEHHAAVYAERLRAGHTLIVAHVPAADAEGVQAIFRAAGAERFSFADEAPASDFPYIWVD